MKMKMTMTTLLAVEDDPGDRDAEDDAGRNAYSHEWMAVFRALQSAMLLANFSFLQDTAPHIILDCGGHVPET